MINMIAALYNDNVLETDTHELPKYIPEDLKRFKRLTEHCVCICGRKTLESLGGVPLANRDFIVISRKAHPPKIKGVTWVKTPHEAIKVAKEITEENIWVIGGGQTYISLLPYAEALFLTKVYEEVEKPGKAKFPANYDRDFYLDDREVVEHGVNEIWLRK